MDQTKKRKLFYETKRFPPVILSPAPPARFFFSVARDRQ